MSKSSILLGVVFSYAVLCLSSGGVLAQQAPLTAANATNAGLLDEALQNSVLVEGKQSFHLLLKITPSKHATAGMQGSIEVFWLDPTTYKLVVKSPDFSQTKVVVGDQIEEHDEGGFYPRWLENFVQALFAPIPHLQDLKRAPAKFTGGGVFRTPNGTFAMPRCLSIADRPQGITEEASQARVCLDPGKPLIQGGQDFTGYISFSDFQQFGSQQIPRIWSNDIPQNIFVLGKVETLEKLSTADALSIHITHATSPADQIHTVLISRSEIEAHQPNIPAFDWPAENTEALEGYMIVYVRTDRTGKVRESYWDSSDNFKLQNAGVQLALMTQLKPLIRDGVAVQMEGPLVLHFKTHRDPNAPDPMPPDKAYLP